MISSIGLSNVNTDYPIGLSLFYQDTIDVQNFNGLLGVLFYSKVDDVYQANFWKKETDGSFTHKVSSASNAITCKFFIDYRYILKNQRILLSN